MKASLGLKATVNLNRMVRIFFKELRTATKLSSQIHDVICLALTKHAV